jgi:hypothetical protein
MPRPDPQPQDARERWKPDTHERYFVVLGDGSIKNIQWYDTPFDHEAWQFGNCFKARSDAEQARWAIKQLLLYWHTEHGR